VFADPNAPTPGTYTVNEAGPGTEFRVQDVAGDVYSWNMSSPSYAGSVALVITEATPHAVHGTITLKMEMTGTTVITF
jgi:hypothetical protein